MNEKNFLELHIDSTFLTHLNQHVETQVNDPPIIVLLRESFEELKTELQIAKSNCDVSTFHLTKNPLQPVTFTEADDYELARGDSYRILPDLKGEVTIQKLRERFKEIGLQDNDMQNFILQLMLQHRIGIHMCIIRALVAIPIHFAKSSVAGLITIPTNHNNYTSTFSLKYDRFFRSAQFIFTAPYVYSTNQIIGEVRLEISVFSNFELKMVCSAMINPIAQIKAQKIFSNRLKEFIDHLYLTLTEQTENPAAIINTLIETNAVILPDVSYSAWQIIMKSINENIRFFFSRCFKNLTTIFHTTATENKQLSPTNFQTTYSHPRLLPNEAEELETFALLNYENPNEKQIEKFTFYPMGKIKYEKKMVATSDNSLLTSTYLNDIKYQPNFLRRKSRLQPVAYSQQTTDAMTQKK